MTAAAVRVLIVDDQQLVREGIASLLGIQPGITVVGTATIGREAIERTMALGPRRGADERADAGAGRGWTRSPSCAVGTPSCPVVMLTTFDDEEYVVSALRAGAAGYLLKDLPVAEFAEAVRLTHGGVTQLDHGGPARRRAAVATRPVPAPVDALTNRETEVLGLIAARGTNREIAARLFLSEGTVKNHISRILGRLGSRDRTQAAV